jgi:hypothetical protein
MPSGNGKSKCTFRRIVAPESISAAELDTMERILARLVALAYTRHHPASVQAENEGRLTDFDDLGYNELEA